MSIELKDVTKKFGDVVAVNRVSFAVNEGELMALLGPMGMIFVPSVDGVSHSPKELTHWDDCARGADVLLRTLLEVDRAG